MKFNILIADDDYSDKELFKDALAEAEIQFQVSDVSNGEELITYLQNSQTNNILLPNLIFLDLNMPVMDGRTALIEIKKTKTFREIPVIVLSTSNNITDVKLSYNNGASLFFSKPDTFSEQVELLKKLFYLLKKYILLPN